MKVLNQSFGEDWAMYNGDCIEVIKEIPSESVHYSVFSPPFAQLFTYSDSERDMGNTKGFEDFKEHFQYMVADLFRVMMSGRLVSVHCMDILATITHDGFIGLRDFPGLIISMLEKEGFIYHSRVCIWKDPLVQATRTKALALAHKQISKDSTRCAMGLPDYIITLRKPGENKEPVSHGRGFEQYIGEQKEPDRQKTDDPRTNKYSHQVWQRYASPVWWDIRQTNTLNVMAARDDKDEKHICPLQLDTIARCLELWTNEKDIVVSPFAGIGSEGYQSLLMNRKFIGIELKESYYNQACKNMMKADYEKRQLKMFD